jgi:hypothetical protein
VSQKKDLRLEPTRPEATDRVDAALRSVRFVRQILDPQAGCNEEKTLFP